MFRLIRALNCEEDRAEGEWKIFVYIINNLIKNLIINLIFPHKPTNNDSKWRLSTDSELIKPKQLNTDMAAYENIGQLMKSYWRL